jgi:hypothetical protein
VVYRSNCQIKTQALLTRQPTGTNGSSLLAVLVSSQVSGLAPNACLIDVCFTEEHLKMNDCYYDKKDWRVCKKEVSR